MDTLNASNTFQRSSRMFTTIDTHEIAAGSASAVDTWDDYLTFGVGSAAVSAVVGIMNTGIALGELLGVANEDSYFDESASVNHLLGADAQSFYDRHKTGVDVFGFVASSLIPGLGAVRGLRALQTAGKVSSPLEAATGLRNPDLLLDSAVVTAAKRAVLEQTTATPNWFAPHMIKAYAQGAKQQLAEALVFESAVLVTMNQNATLNPDDLSYLDAIKDQFWDATKFAALGGVAGGAIDAFRIFGAVRKHGSEEWSRTAELANLNSYLSPNHDNLIGGSKILDLGRAAGLHAKLETTLKADDWFGRRQFTAGQAQLKSKMLQAFGEMNNAGADGIAVLEDLVQSASPERIESLATVLAGMEKVNHVSVEDLKSLSEFYDKTRAPAIQVRGDDFMQVVDKLTERQEEFAELIKRISPGAGEGRFPFDGTKFQLTLLRDKDLDKSAGFAVSSPAMGPSAGVAKFNVKILNTREGITELIPDFSAINNEMLEMTYKINQELASSQGMVYTQTLDEFTAYATMHELAHLKNNSAAATRLVSNTFSNLAKKKAQQNTNVTELNFGNDAKSSAMYKLGRELVNASMDSRETFWNAKMTDALARLPREKKVDAIMEELSSPGWANRALGYLGDPAELLADGAAQMVNPATREMFAKKYATAAKFFNQSGALAKAWSPTKAYYNKRTKEINSSYLPGLQDVDTALVRTVSPEGMHIVSKALGRKFTYSADNFTESAFVGGMTTKLQYMDYDAQWNIAANLEVGNFFNSKGEIALLSHDLPRIERLLVLAEKRDPKVLKAFEDGKVLVNGTPAFEQGMKEVLIQRKMELRDQLVSSTVGYNEHQVAKILNIDVAQAIEDTAADAEGWLLMKAKDFSKPELYAMAYNHKAIGDYDTAVANIAGVAMHDDAVESIVTATAAELTGDLFNLLPEIPKELAGTVNPFASRAGLINNMRAEFGTLREKAQYIGKLVQQKVINLVQSVDEDFATHASVLNKSENVGLRFELANIDNILRREHYYLAYSQGTPMIVRKSELAKVFQSLQDESGEALQLTTDILDDLPAEVVNTLRGVTDPYAPGVVSLSEELGNFYNMHSKRNSSIVDRRISLAATKGKTSTLDERVLYAPPKDLRTSKYHAFVTPKIFKESSDPRRFMIYAETEADFNSKMLAIQQKYGDEYRVLTRKDVQEYKDALKNYEEGYVFDEMEFDPTLANRGKSSELMPNTDTQNLSSTLERYRSWHIRQEEALLRAGVELRYNGIVQGLKRMDEFYGKVEASALNKTWQEPATIWKDTLATMLNYRARGSNLENLFVRVNDFIGEKGSQFIENTLSGLSKASKTGRITSEQLQEFNAKLAENGYKSPFDNVVQVALSSPETVKSSAFPSLVKTLSNLISTTMLRLDQAHSILQLISTPILMLPVLQEAKIALKGTPAGDRLREATTVLNPANGEREPSVGKLMAKAVTSFWSEEGKAFRQELRDRNIINDHISQFLQVTDMSQLNGRHTMQAINDKIDKLAHFGSKFSGFNFAEEFTRFLVAHAVKDIAEIRGLSKEESWSVISGAVDKVHGVYSGAQRPQLFQGVLGQSVGLYQTYFFNFAQNMLKYVADGNKAQAATIVAMQSSLFGVQSLPGFQALNNAIGNTNRNNEDLYSVTNAEDPASWSKYAMYGLASHMFATPVDFTTRGSLSARNMLVIPTQFQDLPIVGTLAKAYDNLKQTAVNVADDQTPVSMALLHGLAHNGMNRPLQGVAQLVLGDVYSRNGQINWANSNRVNYELNNDFNISAMFARFIGTRPLNETIVQSAYFRQAEYKANYRREIADIGGQLQLSISAGELSTDSIGDWALKYERAGGEIQNFNAYWGRQLKLAEDGAMNKFQQEMLMDKHSVLGRTVKRMELEQSTLAPWDTDY